MLKKLVFVLLAVLFLALGTGFYLWNRAASLPDWYDANAAVAIEPSAVGPAVAPEPDFVGRPSTPAVDSPTVPARPRASRREEPGKHREVRLDEKQLNALLLSGLDAKPDGHRAREATKAIRAGIAGDRLTLGAVTDVDRLMAASRNEKERAAIHNLTRLAPWIRGRDFYLGVEGRPQARDGKLALDDARVTVGKLSFDPEVLLEAFGQAHRLEGRDLSLRLPDMKLEDVRIEDGALWLSLAD